MDGGEQSPQPAPSLGTSLGWGGSRQEMSEEQGEGGHAVSEAYQDTHLYPWGFIAREGIPNRKGSMIPDTLSPGSDPYQTLAADEEALGGSLGD